MYRHGSSNAIEAFKLSLSYFSSHLASLIKAEVLSFVLLNIQDRF